MVNAFSNEIIRTARIIWQSLQRFESLDRRRDAAALTYTTLFALVPLLTLTFTVLSSIPALKEASLDVVNDLLSYVLPEGSEMVSNHLIQFSQQAKKLTGLGIVFLFVTAFMLLRTVEDQFNKIWNVSRTRSKIYTFFRYWAVLSLGPLLVVTAFASSSYLSSLTLWSTTDPSLLLWLARPLPWLLTVFALALLYVVVPNYKVPVQHALMAAVLVASIFQLGQWALTNTIGLFPTYKLIYGAFAAVPLFLLWLYISWMILLLGAELSYGLSHHRRSAKPQESAIQRLHVANAIYQLQQDRSGVSQEDLQKSLPDINVAILLEYLTEFEQKGWATLSFNDCWLWIKDPRCLSMGEFLADETLANIAALSSYKSQSDGDSPLQTNWQQWSKALLKCHGEALSCNIDQLWQSEVKR